MSSRFYLSFECEGYFNQTDRYTNLSLKNYVKCILFCPKPKPKIHFKKKLFIELSSIYCLLWTHNLFSFVHRPKNASHCTLHQKNCLQSVSLLSVIWQLSQVMLISKWNFESRKPLLACGERKEMFSFCITKCIFALWKNRTSNMNKLTV